MIAQRDGLDPNTLPTALRADSDLAGPITLRLDNAKTQTRLATQLRGAPAFLRAQPDHNEGRQRPGHDRDSPTEFEPTCTWA